MNAQQFAIRMAKIADSIEPQVNQIKRDAAGGMLSDLATETPVDTHLARSNWRVGIGVAPSGTVPRTVDAVKVGQPIINSAKPGDMIAIKNNLPYIKRLNEGWSKQAPAGFIGRIVRRWRQRVQRARIKLDGRAT